MMESNEKLPDNLQDKSSATEGEKAAEQSAIEESSATEEPRAASETESPEVAEVSPDSSAAKEMSDEELEAEDEHEEVSSDEDEHDEYAHDDLELPDYSEYPAARLVDEAERLLKNEAVHKIRNHFEAIRKNLLQQLNEEKKEKLKEFLEAGGVEIDFEFEQPLRRRFKQIFSDYRHKRQVYYQELEDRLQQNLKVKHDLIEQIKELVGKDESIGDTFKEFNAIQQQWRNTGPVPRAESGDLWRTYHHHVENFYEYIKINKELRDLDFKKNHEHKESIIHQAEALLTEKDIPKAFAQLQKLHKEWKRVGPVEREFREPMWERFSEITRQIHEKREEHYQGLRSRREELIAEKKNLIARLEDFPFEKIKNHRQWQEAIKAVETLKEQFRQIGRINHPDNDVIWDKFRSLLKDFNHLKNSFYKEMKKEQYDNLNKKKELLAIAENLKESSNWKEVTQEMKRIQAEWKRIGHIPRSESDKIWKQFRAACNHYFSRLTDHNKEVDQQYEGNWEQKKSLLEKLEAFVPSGQQKEDINALRQMINEWKAVGRVPRQKSGIDEEFNRKLDAKFKSIDLDRQEAQRIKFENRMSNMVEQGGDDHLRRERENLRGKLDEANKELSQLETNMSFFSSSSGNSPFIAEARKKIDHQKQEIAALEEQMKMLNIKIRELSRAESEEE